MDTKTVRNDDEINKSSAPLIEHLKELRHRVIISAAILLISFIICYFFTKDIYQFLIAPLADAYEGENRKMIFTGLTEAFFTYMRLAFFAGFILSFPIIAGQFYSFLAPGLYKKEKKILLPFLVISPILFLFGAAMAYYFIFPLAWKFFLGFEVGASDGVLPIQLEAKISEYLSLVTSLIIAFGVAFQLPVVIMLFAKAGFIDAHWLREKRKYALIAIVAFAAIITPPDVISQIGLAIPMLLLYECSIFVCGKIDRDKKQEL